MAHTQQAPRDIEVAVGPHAARPDWRVLRVNFDASQPDQQERVSQAVRSLLAPREAAFANKHAEGDNR
jgi:hypothetical protein